MMSCSAFFFFLLLRLPPSSPLFPYTTLFRSEELLSFPVDDGAVEAIAARVVGWLRAPESLRERTRAALVGTARERSEEHTSELQSRENLVCRLLLEKKKT